MEYFVDKRTNELKEVDSTALNFLAPEMYHYYSENKKDMFTETWCVGENECYNRKKKLGIYRRQK